MCIGSRYSLVNNSFYYFCFSYILKYLSLFQIAYIVLTIHKSSFIDLLADNVVGLCSGSYMCFPVASSYSSNMVLQPCVTSWISGKLNV